ncbi:NAD(P)H-dependent oxidoreductase [Paracoccus sp. M683]|uniref:NAD(P)H-dependent oxidoreductase n=1 Tax=Paracoccus sp. M683 TaxID=2594268 RepID=UPI00163D65F6|nr:NAD(P)H-dependent oxidoreductase [Paracoccus sp. M683]
MKALLVTSHPVGESLSRHLTVQTLIATGAAGNDVDFLDLHTEDFDPRLSEDERRAYYDPQAEIEDENLAQMTEQLRQTELLILIFPTWWSGFPAILKGWFDRVWRPGIAFDHSPDGGRLIPRLDNLKHVIAITSTGSPMWIDRLVMRQPLRRVLHRAIIAPCAPKARLHWMVLHQAETVPAARVDGFVTRIRDLVDRLAQEEKELAQKEKEKELAQQQKEKGAP